MTKEEKRVYQQAWQKANPNKKTWYSLKKNYGPNAVEYYHKLFKKQKGKCAICHKPKPLGYRRLYLDHSHKDGQLRGLLCFGCNTKVGMIESTIYPKLLVYLKKWRSI